MRSTTTEGGFTGAVAPEWIKLISVRGTWWCLASGLGLMAGASWILGIDANRPGGPVVPVTEITLGSAQLAQFAIIALAMVVITGEYSSGAIRTTLQCVPRRSRLLLAKAAVIMPVTFGAGALLWIVGIGAAWPALGDRGRLDASYLPGVAGRVVLTGSGDPYGPVTASAVLIAWAVAGLGAGLLVLHRRDA